MTGRELTEIIRELPFDAQDFQVQVTFVPVEIEDWDNRITVTFDREHNVIYLTQKTMKINP